MTSTNSITSRVLFGAVLVVGLGSIGCAAGTKQVRAPHYTLSHPDYWEVKAVGMKDGDPTKLMIGSYGQAVIDDGSGALEEKQANYEAVQAEVDVRIFAWPEPDLGGATATEAVMERLAADRELQLPAHSVIAEQPPECNLFKKKYTVVGAKQEPMDLLKFRGWRTIVVGGHSSGILLGIVARVPDEQDRPRYCHNLSNMQVQVQNVLDGLVVTATPPGAAATTTPPASPAPAAPAVPAAPPAEPAAAPAQPAAPPASPAP